MMLGAVSSKNEAELLIRVRSAAGVEQSVAFVIDTGFNGEFSIPESIAISLGMFHLGASHVVLADGTIAEYQMYFGQLEWNGAFESVIFTTGGEESLLGMGQLLGHTLRIEVKLGGRVEISKLP